MLSTIRFRLLSAVTLASIAAFSASADAQIYKWVDDDGVVHYADQPQSDKAVATDIKTERTNQSRAAANLSASIALNEQQTQQFYANRNGEETPADEAPDETEELVRKASCAAARKKMNQFTQARRLYKLDGDGAKAYLTEDETLAARADVQAKIAEFCD
ncbi:MAG: DUF4124 domain-containing protein [Pseudomonadota bacterium]